MVRNDREGRKCQREVNWAELREAPGEIDNRHSQVEFGNEGDDEYKDNWGGQTSDVRYTGGAIDPPSDLE